MHLNGEALADLSQCWFQQVAEARWGQVRRGWNGVVGGCLASLFRAVIGSLLILVFQVVAVLGFEASQAQTQDGQAQGNHGGHAVEWADFHLDSGGLMPRVGMRYGGNLPSR